MKVFFCKNQGGKEYKSREQPITTNGRSIIKIKQIGICGTDIHAIGGTQPFYSYPRILGHELSGILEGTNDAEGFEMGEKVTILPYFNCNYCVACKNGKPDCCMRMQVCGIHTDGGIAEYPTVPSNSLVRGKGLSYDELALIEPFAIGAHGVQRARIEKGEWVLFMGAGPIELCTIEMAQIAGAKVIALDLNEHRLQFCKEKLNIQYTIHEAFGNISEAIQEITYGDLPTVVVDATGNRKAINDGFKLMAHGDSYILIGLQKGDNSFNHPEFHKRESTWMRSRNTTRSDFEHVINSIKMGKIDPANYITHSADFNKPKFIFESWTRPENEVIKA